MGDYSHLMAGLARMVNVSDKEVSHRVAVSSATVDTGKTDISRELSEQSIQELISVIRISAIQGAKYTYHLIPMCHPIPLNAIECDVQIQDKKIMIECRTATLAKTGVEMEAMTAASIAALTAYDMIKSRCPDAQITRIALQHKEGGKSGIWERPSKGVS